MFGESQLDTKAMGEKKTNWREIVKSGHTQMFVCFYL